MAQPLAADSVQRRRARIAIATACVAGVAIFAVIVAVIGFGVAWYFSDSLLVSDHGGWESVEVQAVGPHRVVLKSSEETRRPGVYGLLWRGGHATVGRILREDGSTVTRRMWGVDGYLVPDKQSWFDTDVYPGNPRQALGLHFASVSVPGELGPMPAWVIPAPSGRRGDWAIVVHGLNGDLMEGLRPAPTLRRAGLTTMLISYREDPGAPQSPDGLHHLGMAEWRDLEAAARYARAHGARRLILYGYSMGGAIVTQFMERSPLATRVSALVLDAPVLDWRRVLEYNTSETGFPAIAANPLEWTVGARVDVDWNRLDALRHTEDLRLPILLFHGTDDHMVPLSQSEEFAQRLPHSVTLYRVPGAGHTQAWNVNPKLYDRRLANFLSGVMAPSTGAARPSRGPRTGASPDQVPAGNKTGPTEVGP